MLTYIFCQLLDNFMKTHLIVATSIDKEENHSQNSENKHQSHQSPVMLKNNKKKLILLNFSLYLIEK